MSTFRTLSHFVLCCFTLANVARVMSGDIVQIRNNFQSTITNIESTCARLTRGLSESDGLNACADLKKEVTLLVAYTDQAVVLVKERIELKHRDASKAESEIVKLNGNINSKSLEIQNAQSQVASLKAKAHSLRQFTCDNPALLDKLREKSMRLLRNKELLTQYQSQKDDLRKRLSSFERELTRLGKEITTLQTIRASLKVVESRYKILSGDIEVLKLILFDKDELKNQVVSFLIDLKQNSNKFRSILSGDLSIFGISLNKKLLVKHVISKALEIDYVDPCVLNAEILQYMKSNKWRSNSDFASALYSHLVSLYNSRYNYYVGSYNQVSGWDNHAVSGWYFHKFRTEGRNLVVGWSRNDRWYDREKVKRSLEQNMNSNECDPRKSINQAWRLAGAFYPVRMVHVVRFGNGLRAQTGGSVVFLNYKCGRSCNFWGSCSDHKSSLVVVLGPGGLV